ncbi:cytochrome P450 [Cristinia sonorae]|uniref:Cytochrome P450 n=1 Tax=Cristinia sonorae TaxID=1940300 RepID=A0A8K0UUU1_9AGAR|nr:cytochrome P450 [Cristinia sonorae]
MNNLAALVLASAIVILVWRKWSSSKRQLPLPPGPRRKWFIGNLLDFPTTRPWLAFRDWSNEHGNLLFIDLPFRPIIVIGSAKVANDLLDNRSTIYSGRPYSVMMELVGSYWSFVLMPYNSIWRTQRRYFHDYFSRSAVQDYQTIQLQETHTVLVRMLESPEQAQKWIRNLPGSSIIRVVYGARNATQMRHYIYLAERGLEAARKALVPGAFLAELIPIMKHIPSWLPGGAARRFAAEYRPIVAEMRDRAFDEVKEAMANGKAVPSVASRLIEDLQDEAGNLTEEADEIVRGISAVAYGTAADTTTASSEAFMVAMAMYPDVQRRGQAELDRIVGPSRLPDFNDLDSLVYVRAIMMETLRWMPTVPVGVAHQLDEDDIYEGYHIPKGSVVIANIWAMLHDPDDYPEPDIFRPERFLDKHGNIDTSVRDPINIAFGFGRRVCAGNEFALSVLNIFMASMLHVYEIKPGVDVSGQPVTLTSEGSDEAISSPMTFPRHIKPRSPHAEQLVREIVLSEDFADVAT